MGSAGDLWTDQAGFGVEGICINLFQSFTADVIISITGRTAKALCADFILLHCQKDFHLVVFGCFIKLFKSFF